MIRRRRPPIASSGLHPRDLVSLGWGGLRTHRLRAALTAAGICVGIAALVGVLAISESSRADLLAALDRLGTNLLTVTPGRSFLGEESTLPDEAPGMIERIGPVQDVAATASLSATVRRTDLVPSSETGGISVLAAQTSLLETLRATLTAGRFLDAATEEYPAVVLGSTAARRLGIDRVDAGMRVWLGDQWFVVIGILDPVGLAPELDTAALVGFPAAERYLGHDGSPGTVYVRTDLASIDAVRGVLAATANPAHPEEVSVSRPSDALEARAAAATAFTALFLGLGAVALLVGGLGVANVMLIAVLERRSEIGLRRALGATRRHVALQFLAEALVVASAGGVAGIVLGAAIGLAYAGLQGWTGVIPPVAIAGGLGSAVLVGAVAGLYPALRAASVAPADALRGL